MEQNEHLPIINESSLAESVVHNEACPEIKFFQADTFDFAYIKMAEQLDNNLKKYILWNKLIPDAQSFTLPSTNYGKKI